MKNYHYTENWFYPRPLLGSASEDLASNLPVNDTQERHILEIGSFEGKSTIWFLENLLQNNNSTITCIDPWTSYSQDTNSFNSYNKSDAEWDFTSHKETFLYNISQSGVESKTIVKQGYSTEIIPQLILEQKQYDIIFIDGNHTAPFVLMDAVLSWNCLKSEGVMIFDDYTWGNGRLGPQLAIDSFINIFTDYCDIVYSGYRKAIKKIK
tara:strand:- start:65 stop:691 length:627 start_codon:yes stop_codon:yes gene_type:complete